MGVNLHQCLYSSSDALSIHMRSIEIAGQNIANVNSDNYATRKVRISSSPRMSVAVGHRGGTSGFLDLAVVTDRNALLDQQLIQSISRMEVYNEKVQNFALLENLLGESFDTQTQALSAGGDFGAHGLSGELCEFFNACSSLSVQPDSKTHKIMLVSTSQNLVNQCKNIGQRLNDTDATLTAKLEQDVQEVNTLLADIADQSKKVADFEKLNRTDKAIELRENRQISLEKLARFINFSTQEVDNTFSVISDGQILTEGGRAKTLSFDVNGSTIKVGEKQLNVSGGSVAGSLLGKMEQIPELQGKLNAWIASFVDNVNRAYDGNFFAGNSLDDFAVVVDENSLKTSLNDENPLSNDRINALLSLREEQLQDSGTLEGNYQEIIVDFANQYKATQDMLECESSVNKLLTHQRENMIGVSIDSQLINLIQSQKAFQAAAKVISIVDELMELSINLTRR